MLKISNEFIQTNCHNEEAFEDGILLVKVAMLSSYFKGTIPINEIKKYLSVTDIGKLLVFNGMDFDGQYFYFHGAEGIEQ